MAATAPEKRRSVAELRRECERRGLSTAGCVERTDLEALLASAPAAAGGELREAREELESWVGYGPRAVALLDFLSASAITVPILQQTKLGITVRRYTKHSDKGVASRAGRLIEQWKALLHGPKQALAPAAENESEEEEASSESSGESNKEEDDVEVVEVIEGGEKPGAAAERRQGVWQETVQSHNFRGRKERFHTFMLKRPFGTTKWAVRVRISESQHRKDCKELLQRMAVDFGAVAPQGDEVREEDRQVITRLQRLEERFRGSGVTEGEARNAMRLFERELSKANWTEERFGQLKRQMAGTEEWSAADAVVETALLWLEKGKRRQAWFSDAAMRIAMPLGLESGYCDNGGCVFAGPLSAAAGAALTVALVSHLADLDLQRAAAARKKISAPQFLQGFVDGALERERHLVWEKLFSIEDEAEAARYCEESLRSGFFDGDRENEEERGEEQEDLQGMLRNLFASRRGGSSASSRRPDEDRPQARSHAPPAPAPQDYTPFAGKGRRLDEQADAASPGASPKKAGAAGGGKDEAGGREQQSWALTFTSNLELVRSSRRRSQDVARKQYHWTFSGRAVKPTQTGTESYSKGREAGQQRKREIDGAAGSAQKKFQKKPRLAIER